MIELDASSEKTQRAKNALLRFFVIRLQRSHIPLAAYPPASP